MNTAISMAHSDEAFYRDRKAMLMYPLIVLPFVVVLFFMFGGGKGERYREQQAIQGKPGATGFNANVPPAKNGEINGRDVDASSHGTASAGQVLSSFTHTKHDSTVKGLRSIPVNEPSDLNQASSLTGVKSASAVVAPAPGIAEYKAARRGKRRRSTTSAPNYYYNAPGYASTGSDQQVASQLRTYENARYIPPTRSNMSANQPTGETISGGRGGEDVQGATVQLSDHLTATRLSEPTNAADAFNTAPTSGSRRQAERAVLSGGNSYGSKKTVAWMIPVVVHEDQLFTSGNTVKLRLTKEISADGITIPTNTILHAICQSGVDRLRMVVRSLQLNGQLIPLDLEVYDIDGIAGVNMPGLSNQVGGQIQSSAIQGVQLPGLGGLVNTVASQARMSASNSVRQTSVRLKAGYNLYLKAQ